ncbi:hypothetical protein ABET51_03845 [Metabacillus fastidiosus]|uniref:hypothetical protein n=1 Tax=Metabacillus fastidiosus TaxID=1458 RepID=UPI003D2BD5BD
MRYEIHHAYTGKDGFEDIINTQELIIDNINMKIIEEETGLKAPLTSWDMDENVPPGDIVKIHLLLNDKEITNPDKIWLSNRERGSRYFSWLDILTVKDRMTGEKQIKIVQRLTDDDSMDYREWKIITIYESGDSEEEKLNYTKRGENKLGVKLINFSDTGLMYMGYYSDILQGYPSLIFPVIYPVLTSLAGMILLIITMRLYFKRKRTPFSE